MSDDLTLSADRRSSRGMGATQRLLLETIKRGGRITLAEARTALSLSLGTVREHMNALAAQGLVAQAGTRREGPGRPELVYRLTEEGHARFPQKAHQILSELVGFLLEAGHEAPLRRFFEQRIAGRLAAVQKRVAGLRGRRRVEEIAQIMSEEGFMAEVEEGESSRRFRLRLCHCPLKEVVDKTKLPCRLEIAFVERLLQQSLERTSYIPAGDSSCSYAVVPKGQRRRAK